MQLTALFRSILLRLLGGVHVSFALVLMACTEQSEQGSTPEKTLPPIVEINTTAQQKPNTDKIWPLGEMILNNAALNAEVFNTQIEKLLKQPSDDSLSTARDAWYKTAASLEEFYFLSRLGIIEAQYFRPLTDSLFNVAAWPIQPGYLDAYGAHIYSGLIFDIGAPINEETLRNQHGLTDTEDATLGIYAIEYLLFGENNQRSYLMFKPITALSKKNIEDGYESLDELPRNRRRALLNLQSRLLTKDVADLRAIWSDKQTNILSAHFQNRSEESQLTLLTQTTQNTLTEQILAIAGLLKTPQAQDSETKLWHSQQLADRIAAQLSGLSKILKHTSESSLQALSDPSLECVASTRKISSLEPVGRDGKTSRSSWQEVYDCIRQLTRALEPNHPINIKSGQALPEQAIPE